MPLYEFQCLRCGFVFDQLQAVSDPPPRCPRPLGAKNDEWAKFFLEARGAFRRGGLVTYPGLNRRVGPEFEHTVLHLNREADPDGVHTEPETKTLGEWVEELFSDDPCGGETKRLVSLNNFQLKGGGWADTGYDH
jgi:putative FmdB family regulatory protein